MLPIRELVLEVLALCVVAMCCTFGVSVWGMSCCVIAVIFGDFKGGDIVPGRNFSLPCTCGQYPDDPWRSSAVFMTMHRESSHSDSRG